MSTTKPKGPIDPRLLRHSTASRVFLVCSAAIVLAQTAIVIGFAGLLSTALVSAIGGAGLADILPLVGAAIALVVVRAGLLAAAEHVAARGSARASLQLRAALVAAIERRGPGWLAGRSAATLAVTAGHGLEALDAYFGRYLPQLVAMAIATPILIVTILIADPISGLTVIATMPLIPIFMVLIGLATRSVQQRQYDTLGRLASRFVDTVEGLGTLKIFGRQHRAAASIEQVTRDYKRETMTVLRVSFLSGFALEFFASISVAILAVTIGFRLLAGEMPLTIGLFVLLLAPEAYLPIRQVGVQFHAAAEGTAAADEIFAVLEEPSRKVGDVDAEAAPTGAVTDRPLLEARTLRVSHSERTIGPIDIAVSAGEIVLVEGPSGAGKSSVLAALLGFTDMDGEVRIDGHRVDHARGVLAWAGQSPRLLSGTVGENVALGDDEPDVHLLSACLATAQAADLDPATTLGAAGAGLSGGQAQRVAVARALYRLRRGRARVLALDEPSSALDAVTEAGLWAALRAEADAGAGVLLISHRVTARTIADRVIRLDAAEVTA